LAGLKKFVYFFGSFWALTLKKFFFQQDIYKMFVRNARLDLRPRSDVIKIWDARFKIYFCLITGNVCIIAV